MRNASGQGTLQTRADCDSSHLRAALAVLSGALISGPEERVAAELSKVMVATRRPRQMASDEDVDLYLATMVQALMDYPVDVVIWALGKQRAKSEYWPAEAEVRRLCDAAVAERLSAKNEAERLYGEALDRERTRKTQARSYSGPAAEFMQRARARATKGVNLTFFEKYSMRIEGGTIWVRAPIQETVVKRLAGDIADELGFEIKRCTKIPSSFPPDDSPPVPQQVRARLADNLRRVSRGLLAQKPRHVSQADWDKQMREMAGVVIAEHEGDDQ